MVNKVDSQNFETEVLNSQVPVLVDFYADWCGPCKMMAPVVEALSEQMDGAKVKFAKLNVDESGNIAASYRVMTIPTFIIFKDGKAAATFVGAMSQNELKEKLEQVLA